MATLRMLYVLMELISIIRSFLLCCCWYNFYYTLLSSIYVQLLFLPSFTFFCLSLHTILYTLLLSFSLSLFTFLVAHFSNTYSLGFCINVLFLDGTNCRRKKTSQHSNFLPHKCTNTDVLVYTVYILHLLVCVQNRTQLTSRSIIYDLNRWALFWHSSVQCFYEHMFVCVSALLNTHTFSNSLFTE